MATPGRTPRLLIVGLNYAPEAVGIGPYTTGLAEALTERGWDVRVVAGQPYYPEWQPRKGQRGWWRTGRENGVAITRCPHYIPFDPTGAKRLVHHASFALSAAVPAVAAALRHRPDHVLAVAPSLLSVPVALAAARISGARSWIHVQDFEVEAAFATGLLSESSRLARMARGAEGRLLRSADMVTTISPQMAARLAARGVRAGRIGEMRNWANHTDAIAGASGTTYRAEWGLGDKRVALYSGNIGNKQGLELVIEAARTLSERDDIVFLVCGNGPNRARLERLAEGLPNIRFHDLQPAGRVGELLRMADVHVLPQMAGAADLVLPSKLTNMLASGRPVVATAEAGTGLADEVEGCGIVVPPADAQALADAVRTLVDDPAQARSLGDEGQRRAHERWSRDAIVERIEADLLQARS